LNDNTSAYELAKLVATVQHLSKVVETDAISRKEIYRSLHDIDKKTDHAIYRLGALENIDKKVDHVIYRVDNLETDFRETAPTIQEWIATKHKIQGAGWLGKTLWIIGGFLLGAAASTYGFISTLWK